MEIIGYILSALIGLSLGLTGGGGSILTVPVLVYVFGVPPMLSIAYSLFIVGTTSLVGAYTNYRKNLISIKTAILLGSASIIAVVITRKYILPIIPYNLFSIGRIVVNKEELSMILFSILMLLTSITTLTGSRKIKVSPSLNGNNHTGKLIGNGVIVGVVTGLLGAGGGFLLIPVLMNFLKMPIKVAIGTSLLIIGMNSMVGFISDIGLHDMDWRLVIVISGISIIGVVVGSVLARRISGENLKLGFGWFVLVMGIYIFSREIFQIFS
jgi:uncharacterized membrane protein YfcA